MPDDGVLVVVKAEVYIFQKLLNPSKDGGVRVSGSRYWVIHAQNPRRKPEERNLAAAILFDLINTQREKLDNSTDKEARRREELDIMTDFLGNPPAETIAKIRNEKARRYINSMRKVPFPFKHKFLNADPLALRLLEHLLAFDPKDRPTAEEALADPYFHDLANLDLEPSTNPISKLEFEFEFERRNSPKIMSGSCSTTRERVHPPKEESGGQNDEADKQSTYEEYPLKTDQPNPHGRQSQTNYSPRSLLNSATISDSKFKIILYLFNDGRKQNREVFQTDHRLIKKRMKLLGAAQELAISSHRSGSLPKIPNCTKRPQSILHEFHLQQALHRVDPPMENVCTRTLEDVSSLPLFISPDGNRYVRQYGYA
ncbi:hypothetical protein SAY86_015368 [Trapa natans]|uniref:Mitogen-activated protein kinase n=1 Tax=Trapa natans TaxID=22666 RepID=A0AAN7KMX1_TRANT|nr:hypothetical protein SAY86_015368 [Trapa natans]